MQRRYRAATGGVEGGGGWGGGCARGRQGGIGGRRMGWVGARAAGRGRGAEDGWGSTQAGGLEGVYVSAHQALGSLEERPHFQTLAKAGLK